MSAARIGAVCASALLAISLADDTCASGSCSDDLVSALQLGRRGAKPELEWRDAIEHEREVFGKMELLQRGGPEHILAPNAQAPPEDPDAPLWGPPFPVFQWPAYGFANYAVPTGADVPGVAPLAPAPVPEPLRDVPHVSSENGLLETSLTIDAGWLHVKGTGVRVRTRLYNDSYPGPTLRVRRGDRIKLKLVNKLCKSAPNEQAWLRREGQATPFFPDGVPRDFPTYQYVGQSEGKPDRMKGVANTFHDINVTNLHTHGWHVSAQPGQDDVLGTVIGPGESHTYEYLLSPYHNAGNSWYHPHNHGSVTVQTSGGLVGALIVEDEEGEAPDWVSKAREVVAIIHETAFSYFGPDYMKFFPNDPYTGCFPYRTVNTQRCALGHREGLLANLSGDKVWKLEYEKGFGFAMGDRPPVQSFYSVNGQYKPFVEVKTGEWIRLRLIFASGNYPVQAVFNDSRCEMHLVAKDSVWLPKAPRKLKKGCFFGAGQRAQVMVRCSAAGSYMIHSLINYNFATVEDSLDIMEVRVTGPDMTLDEPEQWTPDRPRYLNNLYDLPYSEIHQPEVPNGGAYVNEINGAVLDSAIDGGGPGNVLHNKTIDANMLFDFINVTSFQVFPQQQFEISPVRFTINNMTFNSSKPAASWPTGKVIEMRLNGMVEHAWHLHVNPVQFSAFEGLTEEEVRDEWGGYYEIGDWHDTIEMPTNRAREPKFATFRLKVRFQTDCYTGAQVLHCHVLYHEDLGMFNWYNVTGEPLAFNPKFKNEGIFANPPPQCLKNGQQCAPPQCTDYKYGTTGS